MSLDALKWAVKAPAFANRKLVLVVLADYAGQTNTCWPSVATIAEVCGLGLRTVQVCLRELERDGLISVDVRHDASSIYTLRVGTSLTKPAREVKPRRKAVRENCTTPPQELHHPDADFTEIPAKSAPKPTNEPANEPTKQAAFASLTNVREELGAKVKKRSARQAALDANDPDFAEWWQAYPNSIGRAAAFTAYQTARREGRSAEFLLEKLKAWLAVPGLYKPDHQLHASTWLNGGRWTDVEKTHQSVALTPQSVHKPKPSDWARRIYSGALRSPVPGRDFDIELKVDSEP